MTTYYGRDEDVFQGGDTIFSISFPYIKEDYVEVYVNGVQTLNFEFLTAQSIRINDTLKVGDSIVRKRKTPIDETLVTFTDTSLLKAEVQNLAQDQTFYAVQENIDNNTLFEIDINNTIDDFKTEVHSSLQTQTTNINNFKSEINGQIADFIEISETIEADYANVQAATQTCIDNAATATTKANEAVASAEALTGAVDDITANTNAIGTLSNLNTTEKSNLVGAINEIRHIHSNKTLLDALISNGNGNSFLANDGTYKEVSGGVSAINALGSLTSNASPLAGKINTATFSGIPNITLPTITDGTKEATVILDFTSSTAGNITFASGTINKKDGKALTYSTLSGIRNRLICKTIDSGNTWEVELKIFGGVETTFVQATLSANGTLGGDSLAVSCTTGVNAAAYLAFDGSTSTQWYANTIPSALIMYNPKALKATSFGIRNSSDGAGVILGYTVYGSNDNSTYTALTSGTNAITTGSTTWTITVPEANRDFYNYYKLYASSVNSANPQIVELTINAVYIAT